MQRTLSFLNSTFGKVVMLSLLILSSALGASVGHADAGITFLMVGAVLGQGIIPSGAIGNELTYITRRAFIPKLVVQIYNATPTLAALIGNSQPAMGGISSVSVPIQTGSATAPQWSDFSGSFNSPGYTPFANLAEFDLKLNICPIPFLGMEGIVQLNHAVIPRIEAVMDDATNNTMLSMTTALFNNFTDTQAFIGFPGAIDNGGNLNDYGNVDRTTVPQWQSTVYDNNGANLTRQLVLQYLTGTVKNGGAMPNFGVCGMGTWTILAQDYVGQESYQITPGSSFVRTADGPEAAFQALMVAGVPVFCDPYCPEGVLYIINTDYLSMYIHEQASFAFTGFESTLPNWQVGYIGALLTVAEMVCTKPIAQTRVDECAFVSL